MERENIILREIIGRRKYQSTIHIAINKKLITDIANQTKIPNIIISTDTSNYFNRVAHLIATIVYSNFRLLN
jgi:hypothetical protein